MFLPIGDVPNPRGIPYVNYALIAANVLVFLFVSLPLMSTAVDPSSPEVRELLRGLILANPGVPADRVIAQALQDLSAYEVFVLRHGYVPSDPSVIDLFVSMFLHGGWLHLVGNMLFLWIYGDNVEHRLGRLGYLAAYLATGAAATLTFAAFVPERESHVPLVGASGAISGVLGFYFLWFPRNKVRILVALFPFYVDVWLVGARVVLAIYLIVENLLPFLLQAGSGGGGVAHGAHIGGFVAGLAGAFAMNQWYAWSDRRGATAHALGAGRPGPVDTQATLNALVGGRLEDAAWGYFRLDARDRRQLPIEAVVAIAEWLERQGEDDAALAVYRQALTDHPSSRGRDELLLGMGLILLHRKHDPAAAYQVLVAALQAWPSPPVARAAEDALSEIERSQKFRVNLRPHRA